MMKKILANVGGLLLFYSVIIIGVLILNQRFSYLNGLERANNNSVYITMNE